MTTRFTKWLKKSGINWHSYAHPENDRAQDSYEIIDSLNPFDAFIENPAHPIARIYRESFWTGISDTFDVLMGNHFDYEKKGGRIGVLDILIFPLISRRLIAYSDDLINRYPLVSGLLGFLGKILQIPRIVLGGLLTFILSPIVALVHLFTSCKAKQLKNDVQDLSISVTHIPVPSEQQDNIPTAQTTTTLHAWMQPKEKQAQLGKIEVYKKSPENKSEKTAYYYNHRFIKNMWTRTTFQVNNDSQNPKALEAFHALNIGCRRYHQS